MRTTTLGYRIPLFDRSVYAERRDRVAAAVRDADLDVMAVTVPEHIYWLIGLDHFGYFAFHLLVIPADGEPVLVARKMEHVTIGRDVPDLDFAGYGDHDDVTQHCVDVIRSLVPSAKRIGLEESSLYLLASVAHGIRNAFPSSEIVDASDLVASRRLVQSPAELDVTRQTARISDAMTTAAIAAAGAGVTEREVATAAVEAMMRAGGEPPAFWPFVRATSRFNEDHTTWTDYPLRSGDGLFIELAGSIGRYHAPMGRLIFVGEAPSGSEFVSGVAIEAFDAAMAAARHLTPAGEVYRAWQTVVDEAGLAHYRRHHCGYATGIGFPPSWSGGGVPRALRPESTTPIATGMVFHMMSWMLETGAGDYFVSDTVAVGDNGAERLTTSRRTLTVV
ncbi:MAG: Xaa-Pro peptidase family protein [Acidimicrobiia bacterium]